MEWEYLCYGCAGSEQSEAIGVNVVVEAKETTTVGAPMLVVALPNTSTTVVTGDHVCALQRHRGNGGGLMLK